MAKRTNAKIKCKPSQVYKDDDPLEDLTAESDTDTRSVNKNTLKLFIKRYAALPELWHTEHPWYFKKGRRYRAYEQLLDIYKKIKPEADVESVKKKINALRSNYRHEIKKISLDGCYKPTSWVFYELQFLSNVPVVEEKRQSENGHTPNTTDNTNNQNVTLISSRPRRSGGSLPMTINQIVVKKRKLSNDGDKSCTYPNKLSELKDMNKTPAIAIAWGEKLLELAPQQRHIAEKAINDILFEAIQGTLHRYSVKINDDL